MARRIEAAQRQVTHLECTAFIQLAFDRTGVENIVLRIEAAPLCYREADLLLVAVANISGSFRRGGNGDAKSLAPLGRRAGVIGVRVCENDVFPLRWIQAVEPDILYNRLNVHPAAGVDQDHFAA